MIPLLAGAAVTGEPSAQSPAKAAKRPRLPKPRVLEPGNLERDAATGELRSGPSHDVSEGAHHSSEAIRSRVSLVEIGCTVVGENGQPLKGLRAENFRVFEDGAEQRVEHFDASAEPASIVLVIDASPSIYRELGEMRAAARSLAEVLAPQDEAGVVAFSREAHLLLPLTRDRTLLERALQSPELARVANESTSNIYRAMYLTARDLLKERAGRKAILLLTDGQDSGLGLSWNPASAEPQAGETSGRLTFEDVVRELAADGIEMYAISTKPHPRAMTPAWLSARRSSTLIAEETRKAGVPVYTAYLAELVQRVGGQLFFLREIGTLGDVYRRIAETLREQYVLGYYPATGSSKPGWRTLRVELPGRTAVMTHRVAYYVPATPK